MTGSSLQAAVLGPPQDPPSTEMLGDKKTKNSFFKIPRGVYNCSVPVGGVALGGVAGCKDAQLLPLRLVHIYIISNGCNCNYL